MDSSLAKAINLLKKQIGVLPEKYTMYNNAYLFEAYPKHYTEKQKRESLSVLYLVDLNANKAGPFSPAYDLEGYFRIADTFKSIH